MTDNLTKTIIVTIISVTVLISIFILHTPIERQVRIVVADKDKIAYQTKPNVSVDTFMDLAKKQQMKKAKFLAILNESNIEWESKNDDWYYAYSENNEYHIYFDRNERIFSISRW